MANLCNMEGFQYLDYKNWGVSRSKIIHFAKEIFFIDNVNIFTLSHILIYKKQELNVNALIMIPVDHITLFPHMIPKLVFFLEFFILDAW